MYNSFAEQMAFKNIKYNLGRFNLNIDPELKTCNNGKIAVSLNS